MLFKQVTFWPDAFHVFEGDERIGIVNRHKIRVNGSIDRIIWEAHNSNFFQIRGEWSSRHDAALAIPRGPIHQPIEAFSGRAA